MKKPFFKATEGGNQPVRDRVPGKVGIIWRLVALLRHTDKRTFTEAIPEEINDSFRDEFKARCAKLNPTSRGLNV